MSNNTKYKSYMLSLQALEYKNLKYKHIRRLYLASALYDAFISTSDIELSGENSHYIINVLRLKEHDKIRVFNAKDGEYLSEVKRISRSSVTIALLELIRPAHNNFNDKDDDTNHNAKQKGDIQIALSAIKAESFLAAVDMAVQLGASSICPVSSERSQAQYHHLNYNRINKRMTQATEQSDRIDIPTSYKLLSLKDYLNANKKTIIINADEEESKRYISDLDKSILLTPKISILIGPEGGFSDAEKSLMRHSSNIYSVKLSSNILRSEVAVCASLSQLIMARDIAIRAM